jgi:polyisoprenoid-binding protein YceI
MLQKILTTASCVLITGLLLAACGGATAPPLPTPAPAAPAPTAAPPAPAVIEPAAAGQTFVIDPAQTTASYIVAEEFFGGALGQLGIQPGLVNTIGRTQEVNGQLQLDLSNPAAPGASGQFTVDLRTLASDQPRRDNRIREANLESNRFPLAEFTLTSLENTPASYTEGEEVAFTANGNLTIRDITRPVAFEVTARRQGNLITGVAVTQLKMTGFGFDPPNFANLFSVANDFTVQVEFTFTAQ